MQKYHVILIGDVPPEKLGATEQAVNRWLELLVEFVEFGGGLGLMYGEQAMPERYRGTALADLLPVVLEDPLEVRDIEQRLDRTEPFRPQLENRTIPHDIVMLSRNPEDNLRLWERDLEGLLVYYPVQQAKAGAEVILRHPSDENRFGKRVLAAAGTYPRGRTFFMATDETWRWRMGYGERYHDTFWRNVVRYLAAGRLRRRDDRVELRLNKLVAETGEQVKISLLKHDEELQPSTEPEATVFLRRAGGQPERRSLRAQQGEPGAYLGSFSMDRPASLSVLVYEDDNPSGKVLAREDVIIKIPDRELTHSSQDAETLQKIAQASKGGRYVFLGQALEILEEFRGRRAPETEVHRQIETLWDRSWVLFVVLGLLAVEWIIRKRVRLV